jgi:signal transduction histidine kinase
MARSMVSSSLSKASAMRLSSLRSIAPDQEAAQAFDKLEETIDLAIARLRHLVFDLRPRVLDEVGLAAALRASLEGLKGSVAYAVDDRLSREPPPDIRAAMFRIALEAIANVRKHADASEVELELENEGGGFLVRITDDGVGFDPNTPRERGMGLPAMQERSELAGGWWKVRSAPGAGTTVEFWVPEAPRNPV